MCICINCRHVHNCSTYKIVQKQHKQNLLKYKTSFTPVCTLIQINIKQNLVDINFEWDLVECLSFVEKPGHWLDEITIKK